jgi:hypothetical protein
MLVALLAAAAALAPGEPRLQDRVELQDGTVAQGRVVFEDAAGIVLRVGSHEREIARKDIKHSYYRADNQRGAIERWLALKPDDLRGTLDLAQFCKRSDLLEEMRIFAWCALVLDPQNEEAHEFQGHDRTKNGWLVREGARRIEFDKVLAGHSSWGDPWVLETTHYIVRSNLPLAESLAAALDLECHYYAFMSEFGRELRLFEVVDPLYANVHGDAKSFPRMATGRAAWFNPETMTLEVDASAAMQVADLTHEATHGLLHATAVATRTARGDIPAWLHEGLAEYMSVGMRGPPGRLAFSQEALSHVHFATHAGAKKPYDLSRLLNFQSSDFAASTNADLKYAQAYTLVHFGLRANGGDLRPKFLAFVRSAYRGQSSQTHFDEALGMDDEKIERAWRDYVKVVAGN